VQARVIVHVPMTICAHAHDGIVRLLLFRHLGRLTTLGDHASRALHAAARHDAANDELGT
jgi:hypothetical protein